MANDRDCVPIGQKIQWRRSTGMAHDVFISHSSSDKADSNSICAALEKAGIRCWMAPRDVQPGRPFAGEITRAIQQSKVLVLIFSGHSNDSQQVLREVQLAVDSRLHIVQFRIADVRPSDDFRYYLSTPHWLDALTPPLEDHFKRLEASIAKLLAASVETSGRAAITDVLPLLEEERRQFSVKEEQDTEGEIPVQLWLNFPRALIAGYGSIVEVRLENTGNVPLDHLDLMLESKGVTENVQTSCRRVAEGNSAHLSLELMPARAGSFVLRCNIKGRGKGQAYAFRGTIPITINIAPDPGNLAESIGDIQCIRGGGANPGPGHEFGSVNISDLVPIKTIRTLNQVLNASFPPSYGQVPLELDYEVSRPVIDDSDRNLAKSCTIPNIFLKRVQTGTKLKLEPEEGPEGIPAIHLVARAEFKLGRSKQDADFLTWFWPRSAQNDDRTRRLSKVHIIADLQFDQLRLRDAGSANHSTFEGHPLLAEQNDVIDQRGTLILGHQYHLDVAPFASALKDPLTIVNERLWPGPAATNERSGRGCVRFMPINSDIALRNALWIFSDATFGCSKLNPLVLALPGLGEVEGRFHYYRQTFWIESLPEGAAIAVDGHKLAEREIVPLVNGAQVTIAGATFLTTVEA